MSRTIWAGSALIESDSGSRRRFRLRVQGPRSSTDSAREERERAIFGRTERRQYPSFERAPAAVIIARKEAF